jgi:hypothetical protein
LISRALAAPSALQHFPAEAPLLPAFAPLLAPIALSYRRRWTPDGAAVRASTSFSPPHFRRPPPHS